MPENPRRFKILIVTTLGMLIVTSLGIPQKAMADEVLDWNVNGLEAAVAGGQNPIHASRTVAMMHLAVYDVLNAIDRRYEPYLYVTKGEATTAPEAAIAAAARDVL